ncbi:MAG TPA: ankyrin repeat domain-containing protein [Rickettsia endosymbiont of Pyrocoelia pectoralis]|nr:ankyrin repeat domain-containing protein [Rickettsia endosymbiont of Pyrocoelia pectoralis]
MYNNSRTFTKGGAIGYLTEGFSYPMGNHNNGVSYYARRNIINIEKILASSSPITPKVLFDAVNQHKSYMNPDNLKLLLEKAFAQNNIDPNIKNTDVFGYTLLHLALHSPDIVKFLLEKGVSPNIPDNFGNTTLDKLMINDNITKQNRIIVTELLLQYGALTELKNSIGWTAIQSAVIYKHIETVKLLILSRANLNVVTPHSYYHKPNKNLIELAPQKSPELKAFLKIAIACNNNDWGVVDKSVTTEDIQ